MAARRTRGGTGLRRTAGALAAALLLAACSGEAEQGAGATRDAPAAEAPDPAQLAARGERVYRTQCIACHSPDPTQAGAVGPALAGSSLELLRAKVLRNEYPPGYEPRRDTRAMVPLPHLEEELPALAAYLARASEDGTGS